MRPARRLALRYALPGGVFVAIAVWYGNPDSSMRALFAGVACLLTAALIFFAVEAVAAYVPAGGSDELPPTTLIREGPAAFADSGPPRLGRLALTPTTLTFFDGGLLSAENGRVWNVEDIVSVRVDDAVLLTLRGGERVTLEVPDVAEWKEAIEATRRA